MILKIKPLESSFPEGRLSGVSSYLDTIETTGRFENMLNPLIFQSKLTFLVAYWKLEKYPLISRTY
jgi:hypothetical protein